jgi:hypothetical protein
LNAKFNLEEKYVRRIDKIAELERIKGINNGK